MSNMTKIWLVTRGEYSDYSVVGAFTTEEGAEKFAAHFNTDNTGYLYEVEEYSLDPLLREIRAGLHPFVVHMDREGNTVFSNSLPGMWEPITTLEFTYRGRPREGGPILIVVCWAKDLKHAVKITNEHRVQIIAANEWPEDADPIGPH